MSSLKCSRLNLRKSFVVVVVCLLPSFTIAYEWNSYHRNNDKGPGTYSFGYDVEDPRTGNVQYKKEDRHLNGTVTGSYGYVEPTGNIKIVQYRADPIYGFSTKIEDTATGKISYFPAQGNPFKAGSSFPPITQPTYRPYPFGQTIQEQRVPPIHQQIQNHVYRPQTQYSPQSPPFVIRPRPLNPGVAITRPPHVLASHQQHSPSVTYNPSYPSLPNYQSTQQYTPTQTYNPYPSPPTYQGTQSSAYKPYTTTFGQPLPLRPLRQKPDVNRGSSATPIPQYSLSSYQNQPYQPYSSQPSNTVVRQFIPVSEQQERSLPPVPPNVKIIDTVHLDSNFQQTNPYF